MTATQRAKAHALRACHERATTFVMPDPWDGGSACLLAGLGFEALAASSGAAAGTLGRRDGAISRDEALALAQVSVRATDLPVSADLENGFGDAPEAVAETIRLAAAAARSPGRSFTVVELEAAGVRRISPVTWLHRAVKTGLADAARKVLRQGRFGYLDHSLSTAELNAFMRP